MSKKIKRKFFMPGTLEVPGTKISLKTQPYTNGVLFDTKDPISSFRSKIIQLKGILDSYEKIKEIPGIKDCLEPLNINFISEKEIASSKLLLNYLIESPIEMIIKEQTIDQNIIADALNNNLSNVGGHHEQ